MVKGKIALLLGQADESYQQAFIRGVMKQGFESGYSVCLFSMYIKYQNNKEREKGDTNIFNLLNPSMFDAVIIMSDTIQTPGTEAKIEEFLKDNFKGPVICIDTESPYFPHFWSEGYEPIYHLVSHMIEVHNKKDIAFLSGRKQHRHSIRRVEAYCDAMKDHGLSVSEDRIFYGDFWYTSGAGVAEQIMRDRHYMPEALVCANDQMAIGAADSFVKHGFRVPEDIAVAGYGTSEEGQCSPSPLTSCYVPAEQYGAEAVKNALRMMNGEEPVRPVTTPKLFIGESCGCPGTPVDQKAYRRESWVSAVSDEGYYSIHNTMMDDLLVSSDLPEFLENVYETLYYIKEISRFDLCLDPLWLTPEQLLTREFPREGYSKVMIHAISYDASRPSEGKIGVNHTFPTAKLLPGMNEQEPEGYIFTPVFFEDFTFGYAVVSFGKEPRSYEEVYRLWITAISREMEALRRKLMLQTLEFRLTGADGQKFPQKGRGLVETQLTPEEQAEQNEVEFMMNENRFAYHFQPIVSVKDGSIYSYEALMRSGTEKRISPLTILKYADRLGRLRDIERATLINVLTIATERPDIFNERKVFINSIPGCRLTEEDNARVRELVGGLPDTVVVEMTEQAELSDGDLERIKDAFKEMGAGLAVDDFGTGYSNMSNLLRYMPDVVKIDRSLLSEIQNSPQKQHFVSDIIEFCHSNDILALAEGVETAAELRTVILLGADLIQGYYTARPSAEILKEIDVTIRNEIVRYHQEMLDGSGNEEYIAGRVNRISVNQLLREHKSTIVIGEKDATFRDITIVGTPGEVNKLHIEVLEGYDGRITLENVTLAGFKKRPCINMAENSRVNLRLLGANRMIDGGILVPASSAISLEGEGGLYIRVDAQGGYGIGNLPDQAHGEIGFYQDGEIKIDLNGNKAVGIGSGLGGKISINRGMYDIYVNGDECVGIGSIEGESDIQLHDSDAQVNVAAEQCVCIGSITGSASLKIWSSMVRCGVAGKTACAVGTLRGEKAFLYTREASLILTVKSEEATGIGALEGRTMIRILNATFRYDGSGLEVYTYGGKTPETDAEITNSDVNVELRSLNGVVTKAAEENFRYVHGRIRILFNEDVSVF